MCLLSSKVVELRVTVESHEAVTAGRVLLTWGDSEPGSRPSLPPSCPTHSAHCPQPQALDQGPLTHPFPKLSAGPQVGLSEVSCRRPAPPPYTPRLTCACCQAGWWPQSRHLPSAHQGLAGTSAAVDQAGPGRRGCGWSGTLGHRELGATGRRDLIQPPLPSGRAMQAPSAGANHSEG